MNNLKSEGEITINSFLGGAFFWGSGVSEIYGPQYLMERDVVLVTINYRLGALGLLSTGTKDAPGNAGMKDQVVALKWVQRNIRKFGGDPNSVTISGESAGSISVTLHMLSPMSKGLFHKAIALSGAVTSVMVEPKNLISNVNSLANTTNCSNSNTTELVKCLQKVK